VTDKTGACADKGGLAPNTMQKWVFVTKFGFIIIIMPIFNGFLPFLGDIGHFWRPDSWRKLGM
jgi:hypothetical protein